MWDRFEIDGRIRDGEMTMSDLVEHFKDKYLLDVSMFSTGVALLYSVFLQPVEKMDRLQMTVR